MLFVFGVCQLKSPLMTTRGMDDNLLPSTQVGTTANSRVEIRIPTFIPDTLSAGYFDGFSIHNAEFRCTVETTTGREIETPE